MSHRGERRPRNSGQSPVLELQPKGAFQLARGRERRSSRLAAGLHLYSWAWPKSGDSASSARSGGCVPRDLVWLGLKKGKALGQPEEVQWAPPREELRKASRSTWKLCLEQGKLASEAEFRAVHSWRLNCRKKASVTLLLALSFIHPLAQSTQQTAELPVMMLGPVLDFKNTDEDWTQQDPDVTRLGHFKTTPESSQLS